jgi:hypothetical protein
VVQFIESQIDFFSAEVLRYATEMMPDDTKQRLRRKRLAAQRKP